MSEVLAQRQVANTDLDVHEICLPDPSCVVRDSTQTYHAVMVYRDIVSYGQVTCYDQRGDCYLDVATLGIVRAPLRDLRDVRALPKPLVRVAEHILAYMRSKSYGATAATTPCTARELSGIRFGKLYMKLTIILPIQLQRNRYMGQSRVRGSMEPR